MTKFQSLFEELHRALSRLREVLDAEKTDIARDSAIKRFEIVFDLAWKTLKAYLEEEHNIACASPRNCFPQAFRVGLIDYEEIWVEMVKTRNKTAHTYKEALAEEVYTALPKMLAAFQGLAAALEADATG